MKKMKNLKELRRHITSLRDSVKSRKAGLAAWKTEEEAGWYDYSMKVSDETREELNQIRDELDEIIGEVLK
ncbi:MAG: hypothetical protein GY769_03365 [bacterium]|nr:hypothetical protein [bacterium]